MYTDTNYAVFFAHSKKPEEHRKDERARKLRRYNTGCMILLLISVMLFLPGCGNEAYVDFSQTKESAETMEAVEVDGNSIKGDLVDITQNGDEVETQQEKITPAEVYELFMNGDLTVEQEEEQVTISDLFWGNDIEYCLLDIDGDGSEELHIRDDVVYYAIKAVDGTPQILFKSRWGYEQIVKQAESELEWTDKRLKDYATWQEAYIDYIKKPESTIWTSEDSSDYSLIYVDGDDIPELYIHTGGMASGAFMVSFYDGKVRAINRERGGIQYIEYGGLFYSDWGNMGFYPCNVYMLERGEFSEIGSGWISESYDEENPEDWWYEYFWEGSQMTEAEYEECLNKLIDISKCVEPAELYTKDEMLEILAE